MNNPCIVVESASGRREIPLRGLQPENPFDIDLQNTCAACAFFFAPNGCDLYAKEVDLNDPMCAEGSASVALNYCGNAHTCSVEDDPDAFRRADND